MASQRCRWHLCPCDPVLRDPWPLCYDHWYELLELLDDRMFETAGHMLGLNEAERTQLQIAAGVYETPAVLATTAERVEEVL